MQRRGTYPTQVVEFIRACIREGTYKSGQPLREAEIADRLGISRAPVREALQVLVHDGLIQSEPQKGKKVRYLDKKSIADSFMVAGILVAAGVVGSLEQWQPADFAEMDAVVAEMRALPSGSASRRKAAALDMRFHRCLLKHCHNQQLMDTAEAACTPISKYLCYKQWLELYSVEEFCHRHQLLAEVMRSLDGVQITAAIRRHYDETGTRLAAQYTIVPPEKA